VTGLRGEAAIIGIAELPAERRPSGPPRFTLDQYALLAKLVIEDAGVDAACVNGLLTHGVAESAMFAPATRITFAFGRSLHGFALRSMPKIFFDAAAAETMQRRPL